MKVGILLGSFNPIHMGHLHMAASVLNAGLVDDVVFVPSVQNPWKEKYSVDFRNRCFMISLAIDDMEHCSLSSIDYRNSEPYYSSNTLKMLKEDYPDDAAGSCLRQWHAPFLLYIVFLTHAMYLNLTVSNLRSQELVLANELNRDQYNLYLISSKNVHKLPELLHIPFLLSTTL